MSKVATKLVVYAMYAWCLFQSYEAKISDKYAHKINREMLSRILEQKETKFRSTVEQMSESPNPEVSTTSGPVIGVTASHSYVFYEIPYAEPPTGDLRWKDPVPLNEPREQINGTVNTFTRCYQKDRDCNPVTQDVCPLNENEDCLLLNVFAPLTVSLPRSSSSADHLLPVMFYIHGGSFKNGDGMRSELDGSELANVTNTIVVTINYRLGALGFLTLDEEGQTYIEGNQGLRDQRLAMQWVQDNIENFGGDKNQVTIFGNSAGAQSVMLHIVSSKSNELFSRAIQQSNPAIYAFYHPTREVALRISRRLIEALQCNGTATSERDCLMQLPALDIVEKTVDVEDLTTVEEKVPVYEEETFFPIVDGDDLIDQPMELFKRGEWNTDKDMIIGVNTEESLDFQFYFPEGVVVDDDLILALNIQSFGAVYGPIITQKYIESFPPEEGQDYRVAYAHEVSNYFFDCPSQLMTRLISNTSEGDVYFYTNSHQVLLDYCVYLQNGDKAGCKFAYHASEIKYVFRTVMQNEDFTQDDQIVEDEFSTYWGSFARTRSPSNGLENEIGNFTAWPKYRNSAENGVEKWSHMEIKSLNGEVGSKYKEDICAFWDSINYAIASGTMKTSTAVVESTTVPDESTTSAAVLERPIYLWVYFVFNLMYYLLHS